MQPLLFPLFTTLNLKHLRLSRSKLYRKDRPICKCQLCCIYMYMLHEFWGQTIKSTIQEREKIPFSSPFGVTMVLKRPTVH